MAGIKKGAARFPVRWGFEPLKKVNIYSGYFLLRENIYENEQSSVNILPLNSELSAPVFAVKQENTHLKFNFS